MRSHEMALALLLALAACASPLRPMPREALAQLKPGVTTMAQVEAALGSPPEVMTSEQGEQKWTYRFAPEPVAAPSDLPQPTDAQRHQEVLLLVFSAKGVLLRHEATRSMVGVRDAAHPANADHEALREIPLKGER
jgi:outer membrane protein assembly factor BamE (lipoprotein component of BamABCDE complex)